MAHGTRVCGDSRARDRSVTILLAVAGLWCWLGVSREVSAQTEDAPPDSGSIVGRVVDLETDAALADVRVIVTWPTPAGGGEPREEVETTDANGDYRFGAIPAGHYAVEFVRKGYAGATLHDFEVRAGETGRADMRLAPGGEEAAGPPPGVEEILVLGARVEAVEASREESNEMINTLSSAEISKFAASDIADVILRVPGVNVVEGQFAIIRGLEDRYSSTLFNSSPIPSPDPNRQSPQLDLFANEIVSDLVVVKTFAPPLPSNSAGGSINILTTGTPDEPLIAAVKAKTGYNVKAVDDFLQFNHGSPIGDPTDGWNTLDQEYGAVLGGTTELGGHEIRAKGLFNWGNDYVTATGFQEERGPAPFNPFNPRKPADLAIGELSLSAGHFDLTTSDQALQTTAYGGFGFNWDQEGYHKLDFTVFYTKKRTEIVELRQNGFFPNFNYTPVIDQVNNGDADFVSFGSFNGAVVPNGSTYTSWISRSYTDTRLPLLGVNPVQNGALFFSSPQQSRSFETDRHLLVTQLNGDHDVQAIEGLKFRWAGNYATTSQDEQALGARYFYEPCGFSASIPCPAGTPRIDIPTNYPTTVDSLGPGRFASLNQIFDNTNNIDEHQWFGRGDAEYEREITDWLTAKAQSGLWYEWAERDIKASYLAGGQVGATCLDGTPVNGQIVCTANSNQIYAVFGDNPQALGENIFKVALQRDANGEFLSNQATTSDAKREIQAWNVEATNTLWSQLDLFGGVRLEKIKIESNNDPFLAGQKAFDLSPLIFPSKYVLFDRMDNGARNENTSLRPPFNNQILGISVPAGPCRDLQGNVIPNGGTCVDFINQAELESVVNGEIDELKTLPAVGLTYKPEQVEGLALRAAWSQTVARPSFREMGYYVTVEPGTDDLIVGNPQLKLSDVESYDLRAEYFFGELGDLVAASFFYKNIQDPIESIIVRDASNVNEGSDALYRTFFNNDNKAHLWGVEFEARKYFDFTPYEFLQYFSVGGNFTWIDASVDRSKFEVQRAQPFFQAPAGSHAPYPHLYDSRRLYGQPEWIVNADLSFDHPDWGTRVTLAFFAISDVLDAAGTAFTNNTGQTLSMTLDRYIDSYQTLDLVVGQKLWRGLAARFTAKNLTNSRRQLVYDASQTNGKFEERSYKYGQTFSFELSYEFGEDILQAFRHE
jgi:TonB-dependent receptor